jgi:hypothetical protein
MYVKTGAVERGFLPESPYLIISSPIVRTKLKRLEFYLYITLLLFTLEPGMNYFVHSHKANQLH